jgi:hypothetical protein
MAILIKQDGEVIDNYDASNLKKKQAAVGGYIQYLRTELGFIFCVNEEAVLNNAEVNRVASRMADMMLLGDVLLMDVMEMEEEDRE